MIASTRLVIMAVVSLGVAEFASAQSPEDLIKQFAGSPSYGKDATNYIGRAEPAAEKLIAQGERAVPALMKALEDPFAQNYTEAVLWALEETARDEIKRRILYAGNDVDRRRLASNLLDGINLSRTEGLPYVGTIETLIERASVDRKFYLLSILASSGFQPQETANRIAGLIEKHPKEVSHTATVHSLMSLGPAGEKLAVVYGEFLRESPWPEYGDQYAADLDVLGPIAAPLVPALRREYEPKKWKSYNYSPCTTLCSIGPAAESALPRLQELIASSAGDPEAVFNYKCTQFVIQKKQKELIQPLLQTMQTALTYAQTKRGKRPPVTYYTCCDVIAAIARNDPQTAAKAVPLLIEGLRLRKRLDTSSAAIALSEIGPPAKSAVGPLLESCSNDYPDDVESTSSRYFHSVMALRKFAVFDDKALAALRKLASEDPHLLIRNDAREAIHFAELSRRR